jgi:hypothetical protein
MFHRASIVTLDLKHLPSLPLQMLWWSWSYGTGVWLTFWWTNAGRQGLRPGCLRYAGVIWFAFLLFLLVIRFFKCVLHTNSTMLHQLKTYWKLDSPWFSQSNLIKTCLFMVFVLRSSLSHTPIKCRCPIKKSNPINILIHYYYVPDGLILSLNRKTAGTFALELQSSPSYKF